MKNIRIPLAIFALAVLAPSCVLVDHVKEGASQDYEPTINFDCDLSDDEPGGPYYWPNFTADVTEPTPGSGNFVATVSADLRSCDTEQGMSTMKVTVADTSTSPEVIVCNNDTYLLVGTCVIDGQPVNDANYVRVTVSWREATELLWSGWVMNEG